MTIILVALLFIGICAILLVRGAADEIDRQTESDAAEATSAGVLH